MLNEVPEVIYEGFDVIYEGLAVIEGNFEVI